MSDRLPRSDRCFLVASVTAGEIKQAVTAYGCQCRSHEIRRSLSWITACAQSAVDAALEDIRNGRVGNTDRDEDLLDPLRIRLERAQTDLDFQQRSRRPAEQEADQEWAERQAERIVDGKEGER